MIITDNIKRKMHKCLCKYCLISSFSSCHHWMSSHIALSARTAPAVLTCIFKGMLEDRERQRMEEMQMISVTMGVGQNI